LRPDVAPELAEICSRAMAKNVPDRYATMKDLAQALGGFLKGEASSSTALLGLQGASTVPDLQGIEALLAESPAAAGEPKWDPPLRPQAASPKWSRRAVWGAAGGTAAVLIAAVCVVAALGPNSNPPENGSPVPASPVRSSAVAAVNSQHAEPNASAATGAASAMEPGPEKSAAPSPVPPPAAQSPNLTPAEAPPAEATGSADKDDATPPGQSPVKHDLGAASGSQSPQAADVGDNADSHAADSNDLSSGKTGADAPQPPSLKSGPPSDEKSPRDLKGAPPNRARIDKGKPGGPKIPGGRRLFGREEPPPPGPDPADIDSPEALKKYLGEADRNHDGRLDPGEVPMHILHRAVKNPNRGATYAELERAYKRLGSKLFDPPTAEEMRKLPKGPPRGGPGGPHGPGGSLDPGGPHDPGGPGGGPPPVGKPPGSA
jgi:hypothetical protein